MTTSSNISQFLHIARATDGAIRAPAVAAKVVEFKPHVLPVSESKRGRTASVNKWTPLGKDNPGSAEGLGVGPLEWNFAGPVVLGTPKNPVMLSPEGMREWAQLEQWVGQDVWPFFGSYFYGTWVIERAHMDGDVVVPIPESGDFADPGAWWYAHRRLRWRVSMVQKTPPPENSDFPAVYGGLISLQTSSTASAGTTAG